jgi:vacuolar-type H+-ATPase subunit I/STV1
MKATKQKIVAEIAEELQKGSTRAEIVAKFCKKFQKSPRMVDNYLKIAYQQQSELQEKAKIASDEAYIEKSKEAAIEAVMSKIERQSILSDIARGRIDVLEGTLPVKVEVLERIKAISELNKMEGDYAPTKIDNTVVLEVLKVGYGSKED